MTTACVKKLGTYPAKKSRNLNISVVERIGKMKWD